MSLSMHYMSVGVCFDQACDVRLACLLHNG